MYGPVFFVIITVTRPTRLSLPPCAASTPASGPLAANQRQPFNHN
nr:MAG TPA: hypothetical protein [Caudoviricetes sp.]